MSSDSTPTSEIAEDLAASGLDSSYYANKDRAWLAAQATPPKVAGDAEEVDRLEALLANCEAAAQRVIETNDRGAATKYTSLRDTLREEALQSLPGLIALIRTQAAELAEMQSALDANWVTHQRVVVAEASRLTAERELAAAVEALRGIAGGSGYAADDARTFLATKDNSHADR
jgi:hypothetical protein